MLVIDSSTKELLLSLSANIHKCTPIEKGKPIMSSLQEFLDEQKTSLEDIEEIAVGIGPGSYAGTRSAASLAQSLSYSLNIPLRAFPSPLISLPKNVEGEFLILLDAKAGEYFGVEGFIENKKIIYHSIVGRKPLGEHNQSDKTVVLEDEMKENYKLFFNSYSHFKQSPPGKPLELLYLR